MSDDQNKDSADKPAPEPEPKQPVKQGPPQRGSTFGGRGAEKRGSK